MRPVGITPHHGRQGRLGSPTPGPPAPAASFEARVIALLLTFVLFLGTLGVGWLIWSIIEWRHGRTASFGLTGLRVVRRSDGEPIGLARSVVRNGLCCTLLLVPTMVACVMVSLAFVMGASPPNDLLRQPRLTPWDLLTDTEVLDERRGPGTASSHIFGRLRPDETAVSMN